VGSETWSLTLREEQIDGVSEQVAEENIRTKREEVTGDWRNLRNEERHNLYCPSVNIIGVMRSRGRGLE
jgi:hypothetical protein